MEQSMQQPGPLTRARLKTPRAAAIAGILFSVLLTATLVLLRISVAEFSPEAPEWSGTGTGTVTLALNLVPFAGIAFLWFIGVLRDRLDAARGPLFCHGFFGQRDFIPRHVLCGHSRGRGHDHGPQRGA